ncbi:cation/calcium exchanger 1-like [Canna indica]|uniref:Cation/calcium exchanger 1-like n=1 Tax=Canna indica TaxID=4628 RepID=A0AAQ3KUL3_9LILI|nr:cation/calcium exchanger 1-like [Canna indica]
MDFLLSRKGSVLFLNILFFFLLLLFPLAAHLHSPSRRALRLHLKEKSCKDLLHEIKDHESICAYLKSRQQVCTPEGFIDYLQIFYCACGGSPFLGCILLALWLLVLFYLLGNTASVYFCSSLEGLSAVLRLPPTIAGVTLLSLGNGAPDVFSSVVSFAGSGVGDVGISSVLGGAFFVTSVVAGVIAITIDSRGFPIAAVDRSSFIRDLCFFLLVLVSLLAILIVGQVSIWGAMAFTSLYIAYVVLAWTGHFCKQKTSELAVPILDTSAEEDDEETGSSQPPKANSPVSSQVRRLLRLLELPLYLPRRLTIPDVSEERWSKPYAVASVTLAPLFMSALWKSQRGDVSSEETVLIYLVGGLAGIVLGILAMETTGKDSPPKKCLFPWLAGGFLMSVVWSYMIAGELVALLVAIGDIAGISPLVLGFTVLAWGNSLGDLIANVALAINGGRDGIQIAISGCYAGPIFNTLVGLGLSLVLASGASHPSPFVVPQDPAIFETIGFLIGGLLWALVILPRRGMKPDRVLGVGLVAIYLTFLCSRLFECLKIVRLGITPFNV